jgi:hypothetical protein
MNEIQKKAYERVLSLRQLTFDTNTVTRRAQNVVLQGLKDPEDMIVVSTALSEHKQANGW